MDEIDESAQIRICRILCIFFMMSVHVYPGLSSPSVISTGDFAWIGSAWGFLGRCKRGNPELHQRLPAGPHRGLQTDRPSREAEVPDADRPVLTWNLRLSEQLERPAWCRLLERPDEAGNQLSGGFDWGDRTDGQPVTLFPARPLRSRPRRARPATGPKVARCLYSPYSPCSPSSKSLSRSSFGPANLFFVDRRSGVGLARAPSVTRHDAKAGGTLAGILASLYALALAFAPQAHHALQELADRCSRGLLAEVLDADYERSGIVGSPIVGWLLPARATHC